MLNIVFRDGLRWDQDGRIEENVPESWYSGDGEEGKWLRGQMVGYDDG